MGTQKTICELTKKREAITNLGGANRDRTDDLYNAIVALSQLSYSPALRTKR